MNRKLLVLLLILTLVFPLAVSAKPAADVSPAGGVATAEVPEDLIQEVVLDAAEDTWVGAWKPDTNYGAKHEMYLRSGGIEGGLLKFDLSAIPAGATVIDAQLTLYGQPYVGPGPGEPFTLSAYQVLRDWDEMEATWLNATATDMWGLPGLGDTASDRAASAENTVNVPWDVLATGQAVSMFIPDMAQDWVNDPAMNYGLFLGINANLSLEAAVATSNHWDTALHPKLKVVYTTYEVAAEGLEFIGGAEDTWVNQWAPDTNYEGRDKMKVRTGGVYNALVKFPLGGEMAAAEIPADAHIAKAYLWVFQYPERRRPNGDAAKTLGYSVDELENPYDLEAYLATTGWNAAEATWKMADAVNLWSTPGGDAGAMVGSTTVTQYSGWVQVDVTEAVQAWMGGMMASGDNFGLILKANGSQSAEFSYLTSESEDAYFHPTLVVHWIQKPPDFTLNLVSHNDFHGALVGSAHSWSHGDVVGSIDWLAGYYDVLRSLNPGGVVIFDGGDMMQGTLDSNYFFGESTVAGMNAMGVAASAIGNHEFDWGIDVLQERMAQANFPWLSCNIRLKDTGERPDWAQPYAFIEAKGVKIGVIGASLPTTGSITNPAYTGHLDFTDPVVEVNAVLDEVWAQNPDIVVVDAHLGGYYPDFGDAAVLANGLDPAKVQLLVTGHTHSQIRDVINGIPVIQAYSSGTAFARVDYTFDAWTKAPTGFEIKGVTSTYNTYYGNPAMYEGQVVVPNAAVRAAIQPYLDEVEELKESVIGEAAVPLIRDYRHESAMGNFVTDAMRELEPGIDFALTNSGGLRADLDAGPITYGELFAVLPFGNTFTKVWLTGEQLRATLEDGVSGLHGIVQVSGLQFTFDYDLPMGERIIGDVIDLNTGLPIDPAETYLVVVNNFMASGGDDYNTLPLAPQEETYIVDIEYMAPYVTAHSPISATVEGRITALGTPPSY